MPDKSKNQLVHDRKKAAEEVCWSLMILMGIGEMEHIPLNMRNLIGKPLQEWASLAVKTGTMAE